MYLQIIISSSGGGGLADSNGIRVNDLGRVCVANSGGTPRANPAHQTFRRSRTPMLKTLLFLARIQNGDSAGVLHVQNKMRQAGSPQLDVEGAPFMFRGVHSSFIFCFSEGGVCRRVVLDVGNMELQRRVVHVVGKMEFNKMGGFRLLPITIAMLFFGVRKTSRRKWCIWEFFFYFVG